ncbi:NSS family neurotransmitter:Na+ symporter [Halanaerobium saccharolyticum]|uniref:Transporter n=1 Tax=Halanaerobium saccharolyticum TaxID=43595 RepID=A0A4R7Z653_9FIRM|nr:sodium-dependent transporter [Halanaerobium saccharolyticum]RAK10495.1 NSS family neurotransmitter:Na+ symporter [Halanaerobium saccharolyticum]TDW06748.1 NSS family neurotransmitter:Na+ symporter [Halanaerobium saccharolyticum]TDX62383.1 NSS family neurotransmitter:Na+ symporter [Halanaerobium saccharolyticum]
MEQRDQWGSRVGFVLATIGSAVGLGNIWRFAYMAYENGGGAFLFPYIFALLTAGIPLLLLEMGFGFFTRTSAPSAFRKVGKKFEWIGWWSVLVAFTVTVYYIVIIAWSLLFVFKSFNLGWTTNPETYFFGEFLQFSGSAFNLGGVQWPIFFALIAIWAINYTIIAGGVQKGIEKASKIFMPLLAGMLLIIVFRGITLPGSMEGIRAFLTPDFSRIFDLGIWIDAYGQIFFTLSLGFGIMIAYSSYLPKKSDVIKNGIIAAFADAAFSIITGIGVFGVLGYMAVEQGVGIADVATSGIGLAFIAFPQAINLLPALPQLFGLIFFLSLTVAGLSSSVSLIESVVSSLIDNFSLSRKKAVTIVSIVGFLMGLPMVTQGGLAILDIFDHFVNIFGLLTVGFVEMLVLSYAFDLDKIKDNMNPSSDLQVGPTWKAMVKFVSPVLIGIGLIQNVISEFATVYGGYPLAEVITFGWLAVALVLLVAIYLGKKERTV